MGLVASPVRSGNWKAELPGLYESERSLGHICDRARWSGHARRAQNTRLPASSGHTASGIEYLGWICRRSGSGSVVVVQQSAEPFPSFYFPSTFTMVLIRILA